MADEPSPAGTDGNGRKPRRVPIWLVTTLAAAATAVVVGVATSVLVPRLSGPANDLLDDALADPNPIGIHVSVEPSEDDVSIPAGEELSDDELAALYDMTPKAATTWLAKHKKGVITSTRTLTLTLRSQRVDPVRVTGVDTTSDCTEPDRGTLVRMIPGRGAGVDSESMTIDVEDADPEPLIYDESGNASAYFPDRTIELAQDEEVVVVIKLEPEFQEGSDPNQVHACAVHLSLRVLDAGEESSVAVPAAVQVMGIEPDYVEDLYQHAFLGPSLCDSPSTASTGWRSRGSSDCG
ncbi:hypothetical protein ACH3VR_13960 [Microbacterium sp. B2969]|uniref:PASTA domain-containing protein n=1 Tax=Microbacterium alkaliflavum TaxID=3248839 RepID=A0ABW7QBG5_9MICO